MADIAPSFSSPSDVTAVDAARTHVLVVRAGTQSCAFRADTVIETLRPPAITPFSGVTPLVAGIAQIRGVPVPVVDVGQLFGQPATRTFGRLVTMKATSATGPDHAFALGVETVLSVRTLPTAFLQRLPPLLDSGTHDGLEGLGVSDSQLLFVLSSSRLLPDSVWKALDQTGSS